MISGEDSVWEREPLEKLAKNLQISAYKHDGFWQPMDTLRDLIYLNELWSSNSAPLEDLVNALKSSFWENKRVFITGNTGFKVLS